jgi:hypothetical protein
MGSENFIAIKLEEYEDENGNHQHKIQFDGRWKDSHHFLDMIAEATNHWKSCEHPPSG